MAKIEFWETKEEKDLVDNKGREKGKHLGTLNIKQSLAEKVAKAMLPDIYEGNFLKLRTWKTEGQGEEREKWSVVTWKEKGKSSDLPSRAVAESKNPTNTKRLSAEEKKEIRRKGHEAAKKAGEKKPGALKGFKVISTKKAAPENHREAAAE